MIRCSAVRLETNDGKVFVVNGIHHGDCYDIIKELKDKWHDAKMTEGFVIHNGKFVDKEEALDYAYDYGQISLAMYGMKMEHDDKILRSDEIF